MSHNAVESNIFSSFEESILIYTSLTIGSLAIIACLVVILESIFHGKVISMMHYSAMPIFLMISDLLLAMSTIMASQQLNQCHNQSLCTFAAILSQFASLSSFLWTASISNTSFQQVTQLFTVDQSQFRGRRMSMTRSNSFVLSSNSQRTARQSMLYYHACCWGLPLLTVIIMLATSSAGFYAHTCWLIIMPARSSKMPLAVAVLFFLFPLIGLVVYNIRVFRFLAKTIAQIPFSQSLFRRFTRYLSIVIAVKLVMVIARAMLLFSGDGISFAGTLFVVLAGPFQGLGDFMVLASGKLHDTANPLIDDDSRRKGLHGSQHSVRSVDALIDGHDHDADDMEMSVRNPLGEDDDSGVDDYDVVDKDEVVEIQLSVLPMPDMI